MWKVNWSTWHKCGTKKKSESQTGIIPMAFQTLGKCSIHWATRTHGEQGHMWQVSCKLLGSALSKSLWEVIVDLKKMVNCKLSYEMWKVKMFFFFNLQSLLLINNDWITLLLQLDFGNWLWKINMNSTVINKYVVHFKVGTLTVFNLKRKPWEIKRIENFFSTFEF